MSIADTQTFRLASALALGLLIGAERERRKLKGHLRSAAGIRTFALASLSGGISFVLGGELLLVVTTVAVAVLCAVSYVRTHDSDPGLTTETALLLAVLLGGLAQRQVATASGLAVVVTVLLAARTRLHTFMQSVLTDEELTDAIIFAAAVLVILPLMPNRYLGPYSAINPRTIWKIVVLIMLISAAGHIAVRVAGARLGLPIAGLLSGFVSSTATIAAMGGHARQQPGLARAAVAGAVLSTIATVLQLAAVLAATSIPSLQAVTVPLVAAGIAALVYGGVLTVVSIRQPAAKASWQGGAFSLRAALLLGALIAVVVLLSGALDRWFGRSGVVAAAAMAGLADTHSAAVSVASLVAAGKLPATESAVAILAGFTTNTFSKVLVATWNGGRTFAVRVVPGLVLVLVAAWAGFLFTAAR